MTYLIVNINKRFQMKIWSSHLLDNLSNCLMNLKNSGDSISIKIRIYIPVVWSWELEMTNKWINAWKYNPIWRHEITDYFVCSANTHSWICRCTCTCTCTCNTHAWICNHGRNAIYFVSICTSTYSLEYKLALKVEMSVSARAHAQLSNMLHQDSL